MRSSETHPAAIPWLWRLLLLLLGSGLLALLAIAARVQPDPQGYGTHRQLGLPPCTITQLFGIRCPSCGMTTSWAYLVRGQVLRALGANVGGTMLGALSMWAGPWAVICGVWGRWIVRGPGERTVVIGAVAVVAVTMLDWAIRLAVFR